MIFQSQSLATLCLCAFSLASTRTLFAAPPVIDDEKILNSLVETTGNAVGKEGVASADDLAKFVTSKPKVTQSLKIPTVAVTKNPSYENLSKSVFVVDSVYKCGKCEHWHQGSTATAWCLSEDGLMVTNAHVFANAQGAAMGVVNRNGDAYQISEVIAFDTDADCAIFRVNAKNLTPLRLGSAPDVGTPIHIISNPKQNLFVQTSGDVSRYSLSKHNPKGAKVPWMEVTADYAIGSSGGPVFNDKGEVVGMVSTTRSIYTPTKDKNPPKGVPPQKGDLQMVLKQCVPIAAIQALLNPSDS